ncbi:MAG: hypothetical protein L0287_10100 [Anaerolineae bacterium]|nr:hypothetical protein [Anaerolineae bacterium]
MRGLNRIVVWLVIAAIILAALIVQSGGFWEIFAYDCRLTGESLQRSWQWINGACYIQQSDGSWMRVDTNYKSQR